MFPKEMVKLHQVPIGKVFITGNRKYFKLGYKGDKVQAQDEYQCVYYFFPDVVVELFDNQKSVINTLLEEREYQDQKWCGEKHEIGSWLIFMQHYLNEASKEITTGKDNNALHAMRKLTALGITCLEQYGCPERNDGIWIKEWRNDV